MNSLLPQETLLRISCKGFPLPTNLPDVTAGPTFTGLG